MSQKPLQKPLYDKINWQPELNFNFVKHETIKLSNRVEEFDQKSYSLVKLWQHLLKCETSVLPIPVYELLRGL